jgi:hypothetical protein
LCFYLRAVSKMITNNVNKIALPFEQETDNKHISHAQEGNYISCKKPHTQAI